MSNIEQRGTKRKLKPIQRRLRCAKQCKATGHLVATSKADEYRAKAREFEELAEQARDSDIKEQLFKIAQQWRDMAAHEEKRERR